MVVDLDDFGDGFADPPLLFRVLEDRRLERVSLVVITYLRTDKRDLLESRLSETRLAESTGAQPKSGEE